jgi:hypothetical protein
MELMKKLVVSDGATMEDAFHHVFSGKGSYTNVAPSIATVTSTPPLVRKSLNAGLPWRATGNGRSSMRRRISIWDQRIDGMRIQTHTQRMMVTMGEDSESERPYNSGGN